MGGLRRGDSGLGSVRRAQAREGLPRGFALGYPVTMAAPRKIVSLAHIKAKDEPEPPKPKRIAHHGGAVTTNKPVALLQFLHKKKLKGEELTEEQ